MNHPIPNASEKTIESEVLFVQSDGERHSIQKETIALRGDLKGHTQVFHLDLNLPYGTHKIEVLVDNDTAQLLPLAVHPTAPPTDGFLTKR